jgi:hypothetical protein
MDDMTPERLLELIEERRKSHAGKPVVALWVQLTTDRQAFARGLLEAARGSSVIPMVVRQGFQDDNAVMGDLCTLILENRERVTALATHESNDGLPIVLLLLGRSQFRLNPSSSMVEMPEWFPGLGGTQASIWLEDLKWTARAGLNAPECRAGEIEGWLYRLDRSLVARLRQTYLRDKNPGHALYDLILARTIKPAIKDAAAPLYPQWLDSADAYLNQEVRSTTAYRPTAKEARSVVVRLRLIGSATTPDELPRVAEKLAKALALPAGLDLPDPLVAVLFRSVNPVTDPPIRWARNLIVTLFAAGQFTMATHHAEHFDTYPLTLLQSLALNLLETLQGLDRTLQSLA